MLPGVNTPSSSTFTPGSAWHEIIVGVITHPRPATFQAVARLPQATTRRAATWVLAGALGGCLINSLKLLIQGEWFLPYLAQLFIIPACALILFLLITGSAHWLGNKLGEPTGYGQFAFACAAFYAPIFLLMGIVSGSALVLIVEISWLAMHAIALRGTHQLSWSKAIVASLPALFVSLLLFLGALAILFVALRNS